MIRSGTIHCKTRTAQWGTLTGGDLSCECGAPVQDPYHRVMECPHTLPVRKAVLAKVKDAGLRDSHLKSLTRGHSDLSVLQASLGGTLSGPWKRVGTGPYNTLVTLAGPLWAKGLRRFL